MYLIQYSEAAERLGWNVKDCTDDNTVIRTKAPKWLSITSRRYYKTMGTKTHPSILMQCLSCNSI